jgi:predicted DNA-binding ribbon-helix-helix protein
MPRSKPAQRKSQIVKRSAAIAGRRTSVSLEEGFWTGLKEAAAARNTTVTSMINEIARRERGNLSSALRVFVLDFYREQVQQDESATVQVKRGGARVVRDTGQRQ